MSDQGARGTRSASRRQPNGWVTGLALFAGMIMIMVGLFQVIQGIVALANDNFWVVTENYVFQWNLTTWGWIHLLIGILLIVAGGAVIAGKLWGRIIGIVMAVVSAVASFVFLPYYPFWSILLIVLDIAVIWALCHWRTGYLADDKV